jgi:hypothetical protein
MPISIACQIFLTEWLIRSWMVGNPALPALIAELHQPEISDRAFEAAETFLGDSFQGSDRNPSGYVVAIKQRFTL